jgi:carboxylesterase type B
VLSTNSLRPTFGLDGNHLVKRSLELEQPIIIVAINYRLNVFGFLSSQALIEEARSLGETPISNQGLNDQRMALQWIQSSIHHFGGDASRVTLAGESAGAASVLCHLKGKLPLFQQALIESSPAPRLRTMDEAQAAFDRLTESAGIHVEASGSEKLAALRSLTSKQLVDIFDGSLSFPIEDPHWFASYHPENNNSSTYWGDIPAWCRRTIFGNTQDESALLLALSKDISLQQALEFTRTVVPDICVPASISNGCTKRELVTWSTEETFINQLRKVASVAADQGARVYVYMIDYVDPFPGPLQGYAWHSFGIPLTFYQPPGRVYPEFAKTQDNMSADFLKFFYGLEPWRAFNEARSVIHWNGASTKIVSVDGTLAKEEEEKQKETRENLPGLCQAVC